MLTGFYWCFQFDFGFDWVVELLVGVGEGIDRNPIRRNADPPVLPRRPAIRHRRCPSGSLRRREKYANSQYANELGHSQRLLGWKMKPKRKRKRFSSFAPFL